MDIEEIQPVIDRVVDSYSDGGFERLSEPDKVFFLAYTYATEVDNGGHVQYFYNSWPDYYEQTVEVLGMLRLTRFAEQLPSAAALFKADVPPTIAHRNAVLDSLPDEPGTADAAIEAADDEFNNLGGGDRVLETTMEWLRTRHNE